MLGRFADGVWLVELATLRTRAVPRRCRGAGGARAAGVGGGVLAGCCSASRCCWCWTTASIWSGRAPRCARTLLPVADDVRILATSREPLGVVGEARYRLPPLTLPAREDPDGTLALRGGALFADRARRADGSSA